MLEFCKLDSSEVTPEIKTGVLTVYGDFLDDFDTKLQDNSDLDIGQFMNLMKIDTQNYLGLILSGHSPLRQAMYQVISHSHSLGLLHNTQAAYSYMIYMNDTQLEAFDKVVDLLKQDAPSVLDIDLRSVMAHSSTMTGLVLSNHARSDYKRQRFQVNHLYKNLLTQMEAMKKKRAPIFMDKILACLDPKDTADMLKNHSLEVLLKTYVYVAQ